MSALSPTESFPQFLPRIPAGSEVIFAIAFDRLDGSFSRDCPHFSVGQQQFKSCCTRGGFTERQEFFIVIHRRVVGADCVDSTIQQAFCDCQTVSSGAEWRGHSGIGIEKVDIVFRQMDMVNADVASDGKPSFFA